MWQAQNQTPPVCACASKHCCHDQLEQDVCVFQEGAASAAVMAG
jgi:hypothetical protein